MPRRAGPWSCRDHYRRRPGRGQVGRSQLVSHGSPSNRPRRLQGPHPDPTAPGRIPRLLAQPRSHRRQTRPSQRIAAMGAERLHRAANRVRAASLRLGENFVMEEPCPGLAVEQSKHRWWVGREAARTVDGVELGGRFIAEAALEDYYIRQPFADAFMPAFLTQESPTISWFTPVCNYTRRTHRADGTIFVWN